MGFILNRHDKHEEAVGCQFQYPVSLGQFGGGLALILYLRGLKPPLLSQFRRPCQPVMVVVTGGVCGGGVILLGSVLCCVCRYIVKYFNKIITKLLQLC